MRLKLLGLALLQLSFEEDFSRKLVKDVCVA